MKQREALTAAVLAACALHCGHASVNLQARTHLDRGLLALHAGNIDDAEHGCELALEFAPNYPEAHYNLCWTYVELGQCQAAVSACQTALRRRPDYLEAQHNLAKAAECAALQRRAPAP